MNFTFSGPITMYFAQFQGEDISSEGEEHKLKVKVKFTLEQATTAQEGEMYSSTLP